MLEHRATIPTQGKARLPAHFSYPVGAEIVSSMLSGVPQFDRISLSFSKFGAARRRSSAPPFQVVRVGHYRSGPGYGNYPVVDGWYIDVFAVPSELRKKIGELLLASAKDVICQWLEKARPQIWYEGRKELLGEYTSDGTLLFSEI